MSLHGNKKHDCDNISNLYRLDQFKSKDISLFGVVTVNS